MDLNSREECRIIDHTHGMPSDRSDNREARLRGRPAASNDARVLAGTKSIGDWMARILVAGGAGFLGANLVEEALRRGHAVTVLDRPGASSGLSAQARAQLKWVEGDFRDQDVTRTACTGQDLVFHLIGTTLPKSSNEDPQFDFLSNVSGTIRLLQAARQEGVRKLVFVSSGGTVYGIPTQLPIPETHPTDPISSYGIAKLAIEKYLAVFRAEHGLDYAILRVANPYGPHQSPERAQGAVAVFAWRALNRQPIEIWGDGSVIRDYIWVSDVIEAMMRAMDHGGHERLFNVGSGVGRTLNDIVRAIERVIGRRVDVSHAPARSVDVPANVLDISRARHILDWKPVVSFEEGIEQSIAAIRGSLG
jgi:UDP-glucose 4-epimerase